MPGGYGGVALLRPGTFRPSDVPIEAPPHLRSGDPDRVGTFQRSNTLRYTVPMPLLPQIRDTFELRRVTKSVLPYTLIGPERIANLYRLAQRIETENIPGDVVECGVCNGGSAAILARTATHSPLQRTVWLFDSFQGMPEVTEHDGVGADGRSAWSHVRQEVGDLARVTEVLRRVRADMSRVRIVAGWFQETFPSIAMERIAILNIDADWYESVKLCLETFYDRVVPGGFVSFDDYGHWPGCRKAVDEFFRARRLPYKLAEVDYTARWFRKE
jgi:O-methyltransferase